MEPIQCDMTEFRDCELFLCLARDKKFSAEKHGIGKCSWTQILMEYIVYCVMITYSYSKC